MKSDEIVNKIKKLFALSEKNNSKEEAENALMKAQALSAQYNLDMNKLTERKKQSQIQKEVGKSGYLFWWKKTLAHIISESFGCRSYIQKNKKSHFQIIFVGTKENVEIAKESYIFAEKTIYFLYKKYIKERKKNETHNDYKNTVSIKNDYIYGLIYGVRQILFEQKEKNGWGIVLSIQEPEIEAKERKIQYIRTKNDQKAKQEGYTEGKKIAKKMQMK